MMASLVPNGKQQYFNNSGIPLSGGKIYTYAAGTTTQKATYSDAGGAVENTNPIVLNSRGEALIFWDGSYYVEVKDADDALVYSVDNYTDPASGVTQIRADFAADTGASLSGYIAGTASAVATDLQTKVREVKSLLDWMTSAQRTIVRTGVGYDATTRAAMYTAISNAWTDALAGGFDLAAPAGLYDTGENSFPWRNSVNTSLLDCKNITLWCAGPATVFQTTSTDGADVFQLNAVENFSVRGFPKITGTISGTTAGSNGVSITNGFDNLYLEIAPTNLPSLDATSHADGGKGLTVQTSTTTNICGRLKAIVLADGCAEGFGYEPSLVTAASKNTSIEVDIIARNCYVGAKFVAGEASAALSTSMTMGVTIRGQAIDCQHSLLIQRAHGITADMTVVSTKTAAQKRLNPDGVAWLASDTVVEGVQIAYAKNGHIRVNGNAGECDYKAQIGGASAGSSGLIGRTEDSEIEIDLGGTSAIADINAIDSGGNTMSNSVLSISTITASSLPSAFTAAGANNRLRIGPYYSGSFTATLTGCSDATAPTGTIEYTLVDDVVTLSIPTITGTSNTTAASLTGMPAELYPSALRGALGITTDNGSSSAARLNINTTGVIDLYVSAASAIFTASGTKGIQIVTISYKR